jgi:hypothetical protein
MKGYIAYDYWNHRALARTTVWSEADAAVKAAIAANPTIRETEFGVEAVDNINATALNRDVQS